MVRIKFGDNAVELGRVRSKRSEREGVATDIGCCVVVDFEEGPKYTAGYLDFQVSFESVD